MTNVILENFRSFEGRHELHLKPLTILVGENSSGKSALLAATAAVTDLDFPYRPPFNKLPYNLGTYNTIATYKGGKYGRAKSFSLGFNDFQREENVEAICTFHDEKGSPSLISIYIKFKNLEVTIDYSVSDSPVITLSTKDAQGDMKQVSLPTEVKLIQYSRPAPVWAIWDRLSYSLAEFLDKKNGKLYSDLTGQIHRIKYYMLRPAGSTSISPIRTRPQRTYDQIEREYSPEGEHIPYVLEDVLSNQQMKRALDSFGKESSLFDKLAVKNLGGKQRKGNPVQLTVQRGGRAMNLVDVGYGVSQALPIVVESIIRSGDSWLLLQQPEVHLHPRAQAALGTFFVDLVSSNHRRFVVETHSDYVVDRVRLEIAKGRISRNDVSLVYVEKQKHTSTLNHISLDDKGNVISPPSSYRAFFLRETSKMLGR